MYMYTCARAEDACTSSCCLASAEEKRVSFEVSIHPYGGKDTCMSPSIVNRPSPTTATIVYMYGAIRITPTQM